MIGYHGTSDKIEYFDISRAGSNQGNSIFPGIYFSTNQQDALYYANLAAEKTGRSPRIYIAEVELKSPIDLRKNPKIFTTKLGFISFLKNYFPDWFNLDGSIKREWAGYANEKFETYSGQYSVIKYAAKENNLSYFEIFEDLGFDSAIDYGQFVVLNPNNILSFEEIYGPTIKSSSEALATSYLSASRNAPNYKTMPGNRFKNRMQIRLDGGNNVWYDIDPNLFFKQDLFTFHIPVIGSTADYVVEMQIEGWLNLLKNDIHKLGFSAKTFKQSLSTALRTLNIKVRCNCDDFLYRFDYWFTVQGNNPGKKQYIPALKTNPNNSLGKGCKHILFVLGLKIYTERVSRIFFNYCLNLYRQNKNLFNRVIRSKLELTDEIVENKPKLNNSILQNGEVASEESFYDNNQAYDEDQELMLKLADNQNIDITDYVSPKTSPEQIFEIIEDVKAGLTADQIKKLSSENMDFREHAVLRKAFLHNIDLTNYRNFDVDILKQLLFGALQKINPDYLAIPHKNHRQIEQLRLAYLLDKNLYKDLANSSLNYTEMRQTIKEFKENKNG